MMSETDRTTLRARQIVGDPTLPIDPRAPSLDGVRAQLIQNCQQDLAFARHVLSEISDLRVRALMQAFYEANGIVIPHGDRP